MRQGLLSYLIRKKKNMFFARDIHLENKILEVGSGNGWNTKYIRDLGFNITSLDIKGNADIVGDIRDWKKLGLKKESFDIIIAYEFIEHVDCIKDLTFLIKKGGLLMLSTPLPSRDWICKIFETIGLNQKRTSSHINLTYLKDLEKYGYVLKDYKLVGFMGQWGILRKKHDRR